jgi:hypothetical protein
MFWESDYYHGLLVWLAGPESARCRNGKKAHHPQGPTECCNRHAPASQIKYICCVPPASASTCGTRLFMATNSLSSDQSEFTAWSVGERLGIDTGLR